MHWYSKDEWRQIHRQHLQSQYWQEVRELVWRRDKGNCQLCQKYLRWETIWHCHHRTYKWFGREKENLSCCCVLCPDCHDLTHNPPLTWEALAKKFEDLGK